MLQGLFKKKAATQAAGWFGRYDSWNQVLQQTTGYDAELILEKTKQALLQVKNGKAAYERDSVLFNQKQYPFPLLTFLLHSAHQKKRPLHVLDFGGSLGSTYYQVKEFLTSEVCQSWNVVEQSHYVACGSENFADDLLHFFPSIEACVEAHPVDFIILSSVVQYLPEPHAFLDELVRWDFEFILFDRTAFIQENQDRLTLQQVPAEIYLASYPAWFFHEPTFLAHFQKAYTVVADFTSYVPGEEIMRIDQQPVGYDKGFYLTKK